MHIKGGLKYVVWQILLSMIGEYSHVRLLEANERKLQWPVLKLQSSKLSKLEKLAWSKNTNSVGHGDYVKTDDHGSWNWL